MTNGLLVGLSIVIAVVVYVIVKVVLYARQSEAQWQRVDKTKLREWEDDEDD